MLGHKCHHAPLFRSFWFRSFFAAFSLVKVDGSAVFFGAGAGTVPAPAPALAPAPASAKYQLKCRRSFETHFVKVKLVWWQSESRSGRKRPFAVSKEDSIVIFVSLNVAFVFR